MRVNQELFDYLYDMLGAAGCAPDHCDTCPFNGTKCGRVVLMDIMRKLQGANSTTQFYTNDALIAFIRNNPKKEE